MASEASGISQAGTGSAAAAVIARQDRIPTWSLSYLFIGIIGVGFLFTFFDIFDIPPAFDKNLNKFPLFGRELAKLTANKLPLQLGLAIGTA